MAGKRGGGGPLKPPTVIHQMATVEFPPPTSIHHQQPFTLFAVVPHPFMALDRAADSSAGRYRIVSECYDENGRKTGEHAPPLEEQIAVLGSPGTSQSQMKGKIGEYMRCSLLSAVRGLFLLSRKTRQCASSSSLLFLFSSRGVTPVVSQRVGPKDNGRFTGLLS
ncbi:hypothetical protein EYF80_023296 [Liparis tanakae]|uniref:Uncharacterized protein n=1 Tax=Liparis tanakae TaxID=230148 RepID=A0A4Z2HNE6_9TELE|nr:hypothetical protein EYF80_023296 [Liparis tanakae]